MSTIRRALLFTSLERYTTLIINFVSIAIVSRLLTPAEIGISIIGTMVLGIIETVRDMPTPYLVQAKDPSREDVATAFSCMLIMSVILAGMLYSIAGLIGSMYGDERLVPYCHLLAISLLPGPIERPIVALLRRHLAFDRLAAINVSGSIVSSTTTIVLAAMGYSFMSFAWAALLSNISVALLALKIYKDHSVFKLTLSRWRRAIMVSFYSGGWGLISQIPDFTSYFVLQSFVKIEAVGFYNRARVVTDLPGKVLLSAFAPIALPALAGEARSGRDLGKPYLFALTIISALHWPAFLMLVMFAHSIVEVLLGAQWLVIVPLVRIIAVSSLFAVTRTLTQPALMALGAFRELLLSSVLVLPIDLLVTSIGASVGIEALGWSLLIKVPFDVYIELKFIRRHARFTGLDLILALRKSGIVAVVTVLLPTLVIASLPDFRAVTSLAIATPLAAGSWLAVMVFVRHPLAVELKNVAATAWRRLPRKFLSRRHTL